MPLIAPSILSADFSDLHSAIQMINQSQADWFHLDVMDGVFVPNITFGMSVVAAIKKHAIKPLDVHLMIINPERYIQAFHQAGADILTVHYEACTHLHRTLQEIKQAGMKAGVAINPHTPVELLSEIIPIVDLVCVMSVNPGFGGQSFIENSYRKITTLRTMIQERQAQVLIEVDGGVTLENAARLTHCGADVLVAGYTVFASDEPERTIARLKAITLTFQA
jgi:ribulose-phosphate 3-epimerase